MIQPTPTLLALMLILSGCSKEDKCTLCDTGDGSDDGMGDGESGAATMAAPMVEPKVEPMVEPMVDPSAPPMDPVRMVDGARFRTPHLRFIFGVDMQTTPSTALKPWGK